MTTGAVVLPAEADVARPAEGPSRFAETMLVGGATFVLFPLAWVLRAVVGLDDAELAFGFLTFHAAYVINDPHFAVTYLLFYKDVKRRASGAGGDRAQRARYVVSGFVVPAALAAWAVAALSLRSAQMLGWMIQLMFLLVGWHYVKQGFGVLMVLGARRGARVTVGERRAVLFHCFAAWAFAWANPSTPAGEFEEKGVVYTALPHPRALEIVAGSALAVSTVVLGVVLARGWLRERRVLPVGPLAAFLVTVWAWTIASGVDPVVRYAIPALHSIQYLYFVWLMKRNEARAGEGPPTFGRPASVQVGLLAISALGLGFLLFHGVPSVLDAALVAKHVRGAPFDPLGETPYFATFFVFVNIHHYFMDHVIWRRENPDTRHLRGDGTPATTHHA